MSLHYDQYNYDMGSLLKFHQYSDVTVSVHGVNYRLHKSVLSARSPVFEAMFDPKKTAEVPNNHLDIVDPKITRRSFWQFLVYLYEGIMPDECNFDELLAIAEKVSATYFSAFPVLTFLTSVSFQYQVYGLKSGCEEELVRSLTTDSVLRILRRAFRYKAKKLSKECINFVLNNASQLVDSSEWNILVSEYPRQTRKIKLRIESTRPNSGPAMIPPKPKTPKNVQTRQFTAEHTWTIAAFSTLYGRDRLSMPRTDLRSCNFNVDNHKDVSFSVLLYPLGISRELSDYLSLDIYCFYENSSNVSMTLKCSLLDQNGDICYSMGMTKDSFRLDLLTISALR